MNWMEHLLPEFFRHLSTVTRWLLLALEIGIVIIAAGHVILRQRDSRAAAFWAVIIIFVPFFGALFYSVFGINRLRRRGKQYRKDPDLKRVKAGDAVPASPWEKAPELKELRSLARTLNNITRFEFTIGNRIGIYHNGDQAMPAMLEAIQGAQRSITLSSYIFEAKGIGEKFVEALAAAHARGVEVRVLVDDAGTRYSWPPVTRILGKLGVRTDRFMPHRFILRILTMNLRNHRKILVIDGQLGFTGGMNIRQGNMISENPKHPVRDMHFRVEGPVVRQLQRVFAEDWAFCSGEILGGPQWYPDHTPAGAVAAIGIPDGPDEDIEVIPRAIFAGIAAAKREICVMTPYFLPDPQIIWALNLAVARGVDVKIITPKHNNIPPVRWASRTLYPSMLERGVKIYENQGVFDHTKFMTVDGLWSLIGSTNWDPRSLRLNFEFNLACFDNDLAAELNAGFKEKLKESLLVAQKDLDAEGPLAHLRDGIARMFIPVL